MASIAAVVFLLAPGIAGLTLSTPAIGAESECVSVGRWTTSGEGDHRRIDTAAAIRNFARHDVVLLGESHDSAEHHRWQLQTLAALHAEHPNMVIAFEMFPRRVQSALDRWVAGELDETGLLTATDWHSVWDHDARLYLPLFHFARMNRIPMAAINVDRTLVRTVSDAGFDAVPESQREGMTRPAAASAAYTDQLLGMYVQHEPEARRGTTRDDARFRHFVEAQLTWDGAMAQGIAGALARSPGALIVGIMGAGHVANGYGVAHQLRSLGVNNIALLLPWDRDRPCAELVPGIADAVFGVAEPPSELGARPRLGVMLETVAGATVRIRKIESGSIAEASGLRAGDRIVAIAGRTVTRAMDVAAAVGRQAPGTWLPLTVERDGKPLEVVARFPPSAH